ncbi:hypothetical protein [Pararhizobium sp.]|uniref:hypothetical protein n=1 Tax=Pararhizobium sp. TaxID=1977563 RepID=UPI00271A6182|nr:hypothetical protein [Pararhizobium sp.]MDO9417520.1 hypothetical protein [Pararhizobium sp.]
MTHGINARWTRSARFGLLLTAALAASSSGMVLPAHALSELREIPGAQKSEEQTPDPADEGESDTEGDTKTDQPLQLPMPDPLVDKTIKKDEEPQTAEPETAPPVEVLSDVSKIPEPVRRMRELIVEAAASGDMERLRPLLGKGPTQTQVSQVETDEDAVTTLKSLSGDPDGMEIMAILLDVLSTGFVRVDAGTPDETYVWPYFAEKSLTSLTPPEKVELLRIVTAGDVTDMQEFGSYNFYKVGITADGQWKFFVAGD